jgi:hypothetical protein
MSVVDRKVWLVLGGLACSAPDPAAPDDPTEVADTVDTEVDTIDDTPEDPVAVPAEVVAAVPAGLLVTVQGAALVHPGQLQDLVRLTRTIDHPECTVKLKNEDGFVITSSCRDGSGEVVLGEIQGFDGVADAPVDAELVWAQAWLPVMGEATDPALPLATGVARSWVYARFVWGDAGGPILRMFGTYGAVDGVWGAVRAVRVWADGPADNRLADPASWTGGALDVDRLEVGRLRSPSAALLTLDGAMGGFSGRFGAVEVLDGAWWGTGACTAEPSGTWSLRDADGRWYDVVFDAVCDGCGAVSSVGLASATVCLDAAAVAPILAAIEETVP